MVPDERLSADCRSLEAFTRLNAPHLFLNYKSEDKRRFRVDAKLDAPIVDGDGYRIAREHQFLIEIPDSYLSRDARGLFVKARIRRADERLFHPNVFPGDGCICFDDSFFPEKTLADQLLAVLYLAQGRHINHASAADSAADYFYLHHADEILSRIHPVDLRLPRGLPRAYAASLPRVA